MTIVSSTFARSFASADPSLPAGFWVPANVPAPANPPAPASLVFSPHARLPVIQNIIKMFFIGKLVIAADNITASMFTKGTI